MLPSSPDTQAPETTTPPTPEPHAETVSAYKGFDPNLRCRGFQYEVGQTYVHNGPVSVCASGFHACANPWDVLSYYGLVAADGSFNRFAAVEQGGQLDRETDTSKIASATITISAAITFPNFISRLIDWIVDLTAPDKIDEAGRPVECET